MDASHHEKPTSSSHRATEGDYYSAGHGPPEGIAYHAPASLPSCMHDQDGFYSHFLVEVCPNVAYDWREHQSELKPTNYPRGNMDVVHEVNSMFGPRWVWKHAYAYYHSTTVFHLKRDGNTGTVADTGFYFPPKGIDRNSWVRENPKAILLAFKLPSSYEEYPYLGLDPTLPIRAIYFPLIYRDVHSTNECVMAEIAFHRRISLPLRLKTPIQFTWVNPPVTITHFPVATHNPAQLGVGFIPYCLVIDWWAVMISLSIPPNELPTDRKHHPCYDFIQLYDPKTVGYNTYPIQVIGSQGLGSNWVWMDTYHSLNDGISYTFAPTERSQTITLLKSYGPTALGLIPVLGPFLAIAFNVAVTSLTTPEELREAMQLKSNGSKVAKIQWSILKQILPALFKAKAPATSAHLTSPITYLHPVEPATTNMTKSDQLRLIGTPEAFISILTANNYQEATAMEDFGQLGAKAPWLTDDTNEELPS